MSQLFYVTGGARSGKSRFAEQLALQLAEEKRRVCYLATAQGLDKEMQARIVRHQQERPAQWLTIEEPIALAQALQRCGQGPAHQTPEHQQSECQQKQDVVLLDCLSLWVSNMLMQDWTDTQILSEADQLLACLAQRGGPSILVSNEVGLGIVPDNALARRYRDVLGWVNQACAAQSDAAYLLVSGLPVELKCLQM